MLVWLTLNDTLQLLRGVAVTPVPLATGQVDPRVVVSIYGLAEVYRVLELLSQDGLAGVSRHLQQEKAGIGLGQEVVWRVVLVQNLEQKIN